MNPRHLQTWQAASATMPSLPAAVLSPPGWTVAGTESSNKPIPLKLLFLECFIETTGKESMTVFSQSQILFQTIPHLHYVYQLLLTNISYSQSKFFCHRKEGIEFHLGQYLLIALFRQQKSLQNLREKMVYLAHRLRVQFSKAGKKR